MDVRNCRRCGKIYNYDGFPICTNCRRDDEEDFQKIKEYLDENPGANVIDVSEATGIESKKIIVFLKEGRLEIEDESNLILECERCGTSIKTGRFCDKCLVEMDREFKKAIGGGKEPKNAGSLNIKERIRITDRRWKINQK